jgi:hypothetical protein
VTLNFLSIGCGSGLIAVNQASKHAVNAVSVGSKQSFNVIALNLASADLQFRL